MEKKVKASDFHNIKSLDEAYASLDKNLIPKTIAQVMKLKGLTREKVSEMSRIPLSTLNAYFSNGEDILFEKRCRISSVLGYDYNEMCAMAAYFKGKVTKKGLAKADDILCHLTESYEMLYVDLQVQHILGHI